MLQNRRDKRINFSEVETRLSSHDGEIRESAISEFASGGYPAARYLVKRLIPRTVLFKKYSISFKDALEKEARDPMLAALVRIGTPSLKAMKAFELPNVCQTIIKGLSTEQLITALEKQEYSDSLLERMVEELASRENSEEALARILTGYGRSERETKKIEWLVITAYVFITIEIWNSSFSKSFHNFPWMVWYLFVSIGFKYLFSTKLQTRKGLLNAIGKQGKPEMAGAFLLCLKDIGIQKEAIYYFLKILPKLRPEHRKFLSQQAMKELIGMLKSRDEELMHAGLQAILQVGDAEAIPAVESLSRQVYWKELRRDAADCLIVLKQRQETHLNSQTLLRASDSEKSLTAPAELLRPSSRSRNIEPDQLLRASETE